MTDWTPAELDAIDATGEVDLATRRADGTLRSDRIVWIVRYENATRDAVYVRSVNGVDAAWYRGVQTRHEGRLAAGRLQREVTFVEAGEHTGGDGGLDDALDEAYRRKYGRGSSAVAAITADTARATTLRVDPRLTTYHQGVGSDMDKNRTTATVKTPASNFTGDVWMNPVFSGDGSSKLICGLVRFTPGAHTNWHSHANGQLLVCTDGIGLVGTRDGTTVTLRAGESVWTPAGEEHFHGGTSENMMCHYAILDAAGDGEATTWLEPVTDEQYAAAHTAAGV